MLVHKKIMWLSASSCCCTSKLIIFFSFHISFQVFHHCKWLNTSQQYIINLFSWIRIARGNTLDQVEWNLTHSPTGRRQTNCLKVIWPLLTGRRKEEEEDEEGIASTGAYSRIWAHEWPLWKSLAKHRW